MERFNIKPRYEYKNKIENLGFNFHDDYWKEDAYYSFSIDEISQIEAASNECYNMYCDTVQYIINNNLFDKLLIPQSMHQAIIDSWNNDDLSLYGRFDFTIKDGEIKLLEFNADTPTSLLESAIIQWKWKEDVFPDNDQFNSIHENLVQSWIDIEKHYRFNEYHFAACRENVEDEETLQYIVATAMEAGLNTTEIDMEHLRLTDDEKFLVNPSDEIVKACFKLYPWEWMFDESPEGCKANIQWFEPLWKSLMSNKAILSTLYELFPESPYLLPCYLDDPHGMKSYCKKPIYGREGSNITLIKNENILIKSGGDYDDNGYIYQELSELPEFKDKGTNESRYPVIGSWIVGGESCGIGIRETNNLITDNVSNFIPHIII